MKYIKLLKKYNFFLLILFIVFLNLSYSHIPEIFIDNFFKNYYQNYYHNNKLLAVEKEIKKFIEKNNADKAFIVYFRESSKIDDEKKFYFETNIITKNETTKIRDNFIIDKSFDYLTIDKCLYENMSDNFFHDTNKNFVIEFKNDKENQIKGIFMRCPLIRDNRLIGFYSIFKFTNLDNIKESIENFEKFSEDIRNILKE